MLDTLEEWKQHTNLKLRHSFIKHFLSDYYMLDTKCSVCIGKQKKHGPWFHGGYS